MVPILSGLAVAVTLIPLAHVFCPKELLRKVEGRTTALKAVQMNVVGETLPTQALSTVPSVSIHIYIQSSFGLTDAALRLLRQHATEQSSSQERWLYHEM